MNARELLFRGLTLGCSNHGCVVTGPKKGMATNGPCHCVKELNRTQLTILQSRLSVLLDESKYAFVLVEQSDKES